MMHHPAPSPPHSAAVLSDRLAFAQGFPAWLYCITSFSRNNRYNRLSKRSVHLLKRRNPGRRRGTSSEPTTARIDCFWFSGNTCRRIADFAGVHRVVLSPCRTRLIDFSGFRAYSLPVPAHRFRTCFLTLPKPRHAMPLHPVRVFSVFSLCSGRRFARRAMAIRAPDARGKLVLQCF